MSQNKEHKDQAAELAHRVVELIADQEHGVALQALLGAYAAVAINYPCCSRNAVLHLAHTANLIEASTAAAPAGAAHIH